jgi:hypothetical protein
MFGGLRRFGWGAAMAALALVAAALPSPARALTIVPTYNTVSASCAEYELTCSAVTSSAQSAQIEFAFNTIIAQYEAFFTNTATVNVTLDLSPDVGLGENITNQVPGVSYSTFISKLSTTTAGQNNGPATTALANMPASATVVNSNDTSNTIELSTPNAKALGINVGSGSDAVILITTAASTPVQYTRVNGQVGLSYNNQGDVIGNYDFFGTASHELDEVLGSGSSLYGGESPLPNYISPEDLFRFAAAGSSTRSYTLSSSATAFLSINGGASDLIQFNQQSDGDYGDFISGTGEPCTAIVQNAFACPGQVATNSRTSAVIQMLDAIGWNPRFSTAATSTVWTVNCTTGKIASTGAVTTASTSVSGPLGALLGTPSGKATFSPVPVGGDTVEITGLCVQDVTVTTSDLLLTNSEGPDGLAADTDDDDGIQGQLEINGAQRVVVTGLLLGDFGGSFSFGSASDVATFFVHDGATVVLLHTDVVNSPLYGALVRRGAQANFYDDRFYFDGFGNCLSNGINVCAAGIAVLTDAKAEIGADDGSLSVLVYGSGGDGVAVEVGSAVIFHAADVTANGNRQLFVSGASSARLSGSTVTVDMGLGTGSDEDCDNLHDAVCNTAIEVTGSSMLRIEGGATVSATDSGSPVGAIKLSQGSALLTQGATIKALTATLPTIDASDNSVIALAGGNEICGVVCSSSTTGQVASIDHVSTLIQVTPADFGYAAAQDVLFGSATVQLQSTVDLGVGTIGATPSLAWTTFSGGAIVVSQNSSLRLQGGTAIAGPGGLQLSQGSNGIFNVANGGTNSVTGTVTCPFANIPAAHVAGQTAVTPNVTLATGFFNQTSPHCLPF